MHLKRSCRGTIRRVPTEEVVGHDADEGGGRQCAEQHEEEDRVQRALGVLDQLQQDGGATPVLLLERRGADPAHAGERGLRHGEE